MNDDAGQDESFNKVVSYTHSIKKVGNFFFFYFPSLSCHRGVTLGTTALDQLGDLTLLSL